jgi:hypothetical protein
LLTGFNQKVFPEMGASFICILYKVNLIILVNLSEPAGMLSTLFQWFSHGLRTRKSTSTVYRISGHEEGKTARYKNPFH